jgi:FtsP/CotA-like multicopper oxidase with cupredoxin domain
MGTFSRRSVRRGQSLVLTLVVGSAFGLLAPQPASATSFDVALPIPPVKTDANITINVHQAPVSILPGAPTQMWTYDGSFPGPTIRRPAGAATAVTFVNDLPTAAGALTVHLHGEHAMSDDDGQPEEMPSGSSCAGFEHLIPPTCQRTYQYALTENGGPERPAFQWYHDHRMGATARNVWMGLAGMFIVDPAPGDHTEDTLPADRYDVPLMLTDRSFDANNQLDYQFANDGVLGDHILVNGADHPYFDVDDVRYRVRILNASNARPYDVELSNGKPMTQIGTESGLLPAPVTMTHIRLAPAERAEVILDFHDMLGEGVVLRDRFGVGTAADLMRFNVTTHASDPSIIPAHLRPLPDTVTAGPECASTAVERCPIVTRTWTLGASPVPGNPEWTINGRGFDHMRDDAEPRLGAAERWIFVNATSVDHVVHIHDVDWRLVYRSGGLEPDATRGADADQLKESFLVRPTETIVLVSTFTDHVGRFMFHCHILEHEDHSMMGQFNVVP